MNGTSFLERVGVHLDQATRYKIISMYKKGMDRESISQAVSFPSWVIAKVICELARDCSSTARPRGRPPKERPSSHKPITVDLKVDKVPVIHPPQSVDNKIQCGFQNKFLEVDPSPSEDDGEKDETEEGDVEQKHGMTLVHWFQASQREGELCDVHIVLATGGLIRVHKLVMLMASSLFRRLLQRVHTPVDPILIHMEGIPDLCQLRLFRFLYTGTLPRSSRRWLVGMYHLAEHLQIPYLQHTCGSRLGKRFLARVSRRFFNPIRITIKYYGKAKQFTLKNNGVIEEVSGTCTISPLTWFVTWTDTSVMRHEAIHNPSDIVLFPPPPPTAPEPTNGAAKEQQEKPIPESSVREHAAIHNPSDTVHLPRPPATPQQRKSAIGKLRENRIPGVKSSPFVVIDQGIPHQPQIMAPLKPLSGVEALRLTLQDKHLRRHRSDAEDACSASEPGNEPPPSKVPRGHGNSQAETRLLGASEEEIQGGEKLHGDVEVTLPQPASDLQVVENDGASAAEIDDLPQSMEPTIDIQQEVEVSMSAESVMDKRTEESVDPLFFSHTGMSETVRTRLRNLLQKSANSKDPQIHDDSQTGEEEEDGGVPFVSQPVRNPTSHFGISSSVPQETMSSHEVNQSGAYKAMKIYIPCKPNTAGRFRMKQKSASSSTPDTEGIHHMVLQQESKWDHCYCAKQVFVVSKIDKNACSTGAVVPPVNVEQPMGPVQQVWQQRVQEGSKNSTVGGNIPSHARQPPVVKEHCQGRAGYCNQCKVCSFKFRMPLACYKHVLVAHGEEVKEYLASHGAWHAHKTRRGRLDVVKPMVLKAFVSRTRKNSALPVTCMEDIKDPFIEAVLSQLLRSIMSCSGHPASSDSIHATPELCPVQAAHEEMSIPETHAVGSSAPTLSHPSQHEESPPQEEEQNPDPTCHSVSASEFNRRGSPFSRSWANELRTLGVPTLYRTDPWQPVVSLARLNLGPDVTNRFVIVKSSEVREETEEPRDLGESKWTCSVEIKDEAQDWADESDGRRESFAWLSTQNEVHWPGGMVEVKEEPEDMETREMEAATRWPREKDQELYPQVPDFFHGGHSHAENNLSDPVSGNLSFTIKQEPMEEGEEAGLMLGETEDMHVDDPFEEVGMVERNVHPELDNHQSSSTTDAESFLIISSVTSLLEDPTASVMQG